MAKTMKCVKVPSIDGEHIYYIPKRDIYKPLSKLMDNSQLIEFFDKFVNECVVPEGDPGDLMSISMVKLIVKLKLGNFLEDLNDSTDQETGKVDWDKLFGDIKITIINPDQE